MAAMGEALKPIHNLEAEAAKENEIAQQAYAAGMDPYELRKQVNKALVRDELKANKHKNAKIDLDFGEKPKEPTPVRYRTNDFTYEAIGELQIAIRWASSSNATNLFHCSNSSIVMSRRSPAGSICPDGLERSRIRSTA